MVDCKSMSKQSQLLGLLLDKDVSGLMQQQIMEYREDGYFNEKGSGMEEN